jgi:hypothetical protein
MFNTRLTSKYRPSKTELEKNPEASDQMYQAYLKALKTDEVPYGGTILKAFKLLDKAARKRLGDRAPSIADSLKNRRVIILYQDKLGTTEINARGELRNRGKLTDMPGKPAKSGKPMRRYLDGEIRLSTCVAQSYIGTAALLAHELWHILERENPKNGLKDPEALKLKGNDVFSGSENFADYVAGREIAYLGFSEGAILKPERHAKVWGPKWNDSESFSILISKFRLYHDAREAMRNESLTRQFFRGLMAETDKISVTLGLTVEATYTKAGKVKNRFRYASGIRPDGRRVQRHIPHVHTYSSQDHLKWKHRKFSGNFDEGRTKIEGEIALTGRHLTRLKIRRGYSESGRGRQEQVVELTNLPLARYQSKSNDKVACFELIGPQVRQHVKKITWTWKTWAKPRPGKYPKIATATTMQKVLWHDQELIPCLQVVLFKEESPSAHTIRGEFVPHDAT